MCKVTPIYGTVYQCKKRVVDFNSKKQYSSGSLYMNISTGFNFVSKFVYIPFEVNFSINCSDKII